MTITGRLPWFTLLLTTAMIGLYSPGGQNAAVLQALWYSRDGLLDGEIWRLVTGHLVHFSFSHLAGNLLAFATLALLIERQQGWQLLGGLLLFLMIPASVLMLLLVPQLQYYGGISSVNYGLLTWICLTHAAVRQSFRLARAVIMPADMMVVALLAHVCFQYASGASLFSIAPSAGSIVVAWQTHLMCTLTALVFAAARKTRAGKPVLISA